MTERIVGLLGRSPAIHPVGYRTIDTYVDALPESPPTFDHTNGFDAFRMLGNGPDPSLTIHGGRPVGDCAFVGTQAVTICDQLETGEPLTWASSNELVSTYLAYNRGRDVGANLSQLLAYWHTVGLPWAGQCVGYAGLNFRDPGEFWAGVNAFGCGYIGIVVTAAMQAQTQAGEPWDLTGSPLEREVRGGHCVVVISRTSAEGDGEVATWGMRQKFTARWFRSNVEEAHVVLTPSQVARKGNGYGLNLPEPPIRSIRSQRPGPGGLTNPKKEPEMPTKPKPAPTPVATGPTKENYVEEAERCALVFVTTFATSFGVTGAFTWRDAAAAAVAAATVAVNDVLPISPLTAGIDAVLSLLGHVVPAAKTRLAVRKGARV